MTAYLPLLIPFGALAALASLMTLSSIGAAWPGSAPFLYLPYGLGILACLLGCLFAQSRILFISLFFMGIMYLLDAAYFRSWVPARGETVLFLASIYLPVLTVLFYHLGERGVFNSHGALRLTIILSALGVVVVPSMIEPFTAALLSSDIRLFNESSSGFQVPLLGSVAFAAAAPFLCFRRPHESPFLGPSLLVVLAAFFCALNFRSSFWVAGQERSVLLAFSALGQALLAWTVLETSWRNAHIDELTELPGRRSLKHHFARVGGNLAVAVVDIDRFKRINDRYGHDCGDQVLRFVASFLGRNKLGKAYRYGGEEFVILIENRDYDQAAELLDELRAAIHDREFSVRAKGRPRKKPDRPKSVPGERKTIRVSVSIGLARAGKRYRSPQEVFKAADRALYRAKKAGRNRLTVTR